MCKLIFNLAIMSIVTLLLAGCGEDKASSSTTTKGAIDTASVSAQLTDEQSFASQCRGTYGQFFAALAAASPPC